MTYVKAKPDAGKSPFLDAPTIQGNFAQWAASFSQNVAGVIYNHMPMNDINQGDHAGIIFTNQSADPGVLQDQATLYCKNATSKAGSQPQLFVQIPKFLPNALDPTDAQNVGMQLTYNAVNTAGPQYQSFLPGGYIIYVGSTTNIVVPITVSPAPTKILLAIATPDNVGVGNIPFDVSTTILSNTQFMINSTAASGLYTFGWIAIASA